MDSRSPDWGGQGRKEHQETRQDESENLISETLISADTSSRLACPAYFIFHSIAS